MAADELPAPPEANSTGPSAIQKAIIKEERNAQKNSKDLANGESASSTRSALPGDSQDNSADTTGESDSAPSSDNEHVEIPLDTPSPTKEKVDPMEVVKESFQEISVTEDGDSDGYRTPRQGNGGSTFSNRSDHESPSPSVRRAQKAPTTSTAAWANIITTAVDHSDEHVTKSVQCQLVWRHKASTDFTHCHRMIRSLVFAAQNFGMAPPGVHRSNLRGSEQLDGSVFIRVCRLHCSDNVH